MRIIEIDRKSDLFSDVIKLGDQNRKTLGFLPTEAYEDYCRKGQILAAINNGDLLGYLMFRRKRTKLIVVHLCVASHYRRTGVARELLKFLCASDCDFSSIELSCRRDYGLESFWRSLGFTPISERLGRATTGASILTTWIMQNPVLPPLFSLIEEESDCFAIAGLDTNIIVDLYSNDDGESQVLLQPFLKDYLRFYISEAFFDEVNRNEDESLRNNIRAYARSNFNVFHVSDKVQQSLILDTLSEMRSITPYSNNWYDAFHIATAICCGATVFITRDRGWLKESITTEIFERYNLRIVSPGEVAQIIDEIDYPDSYAPFYLAGLDLKLGKFSADDFNIIINTFYRTSVHQKKAAYEKVIRNFLADRSVSVEVIKAGQEPVCLYAYQIKEQTLSVILFDLNEQAIKESLIDTFMTKLLFSFINIAKTKRLHFIKLRQDAFSHSRPSVITRCGFVKDEGVWLRVLRYDVVKPACVSVVEELDDTSPINRAIQRFNQGLSKNRLSPASIIGIEKLFWPFKILAEEVPCYIVPIKPEYAIKLFDETMANTNLSLFKNELVEPALSIEKVYFKSDSLSIQAFPARVLWYESISKKLFGSGAIRAVSYLDLVEKGPAKSLYKKYRRLGVLQWNEINSIQSLHANIAVYKFSYTELLSNAISLDRIRGILGRPTETFQSYLRISPDMFKSIYMEATAAE